MHMIQVIQINRTKNKGEKMKKGEKQQKETEQNSSLFRLRKFSKMRFLKHSKKVIYINFKESFYMEIGKTQKTKTRLDWLILQKEF